MSRQDEYLKSVTDRLIQQIKDNNAPWQRPFKAGDYSNTNIPVNISGKPYNGMNMLNLMSIAQENNYQDNRWLTFNGAKELGGKVKKGEKASDIYYWKFSEIRTVTKKDKDGNDILGDNGKPIKTKVESWLARPQIFFAKVFNAEQIEGLPPREIKTANIEEWERHAAAERILEASGVEIHHKVGEKAYYSPLEDHIVLPERSQFETADAYYATALHELGHASGHHTRLHRDLTGAFNSEKYAKEELRAEIASMFIGQELQIGHDPSQHYSYLQSWANVVKNDPKEIFRAVKDADKIQHYILSFDPERQKEIKQLDSESKAKQVPNDTGKERPATNLKTFITVPFAEKDEVKALGAKWDKDNKSWYVPEGVDQSKFTIWIDAEQKKEPKAYLYTIPSDKDEVKALGAKWDKEVNLWYAPAKEDQSKFTKWLDRPSIPSPEQEFAQFLKDRNIVVLDGHPKMDGKAHRLSNEGSDSKNVLYQLYPNTGGIPSGRVTNFSRDSLPEKWVYPMEYIQREQNIEAVDLAKHGLTAVKEVKRVQPSEPSPVLYEDKSKIYNETAKRVKEVFSFAPLAGNQNYQIDYLDRKGVHSNNVVHVVPDAKDLPEHLKNDIAIANDWRIAKELRESNPDKMILQKGNLIIPQYNTNGELRSFETIGYKGAKYALKDGEKNNLSLQLGSVENGKPFLIAEGYATGATLHEQAKIPVVVSFGKANLEDLAKSLRELNPDSKIYLAADNDHVNEALGKGNAGVEEAKKVAEVIDGYVLTPSFKKDDLGKDWNDIFIDKGIHEFRSQLKSQLELVKNPILGKDQLTLEVQQTHELNYTTTFKESKELSR